MLLYSKFNHNYPGRNNT